MKKECNFSKAERGGMGLAKKEALNMVRKMPDSATWDDIMYEIYVRKKIERGIKAADQGKLVSHDEVKKHFLR